ncbi:hypothetical protein C8Q77DRAFT_1075484 [Trametes polyzona]|nr:hypothetical protein C8Q77DRAFT_1075484 [Trametes polyzona]
MQSYSNPDVFFCPLYNPPGVSDPITSILSGAADEWVYSTPPTSRPASPIEYASPYATPPDSRESSCAPPSSPSSTLSASTSTSTSSEGSKKLQKYRRMCAKSGKPLLDFVAEVESRRIVHEKRKQLQASQSSRNSPVKPREQRW